MEEVSAPHLITAMEGILVIAGIVQVFLQTISVQRENRGRIQSGFKLPKWSQIYPGMIMIVIGALLLLAGSP